MDLIIFVILLAVGYGFGSYNEKRHYRSIKKRERRLAHIPIRTDRTPSTDHDQGFFVSGSVVISIDYFKMVKAGLQNFMGGRVSTYEPLLDRARREAVLRMKLKAAQYDAEEIINLKIESSSIGKQQQGSVQAVEVYAYGTAMKKRIPNEVRS